ncbi:tetratricopeptide repeat protein [Parvularcula flava]|uniref:Tetratricopeptide repeat protein n=1 Tax=Aquisalinus luteolus TaxID=1566827 RepID=A0A8J3A4E0_9PROT|nr:tetratricopeptide repeat protein [Aquisalinus luteolus]NHK26369.1 tetratricopeptide repeat protein [Aquisalinus luteolus]GGH92127.1 hypothetical protein GCM10011355_00890 [Aquisalinus luteolus]
MTDTPAGSMNKAWSQWNAGNVSGAEAELRAIIAEQPDHVEALTLLALCRSARKDKDEAKDLIDTALGYDSEYDFAWRSRGYILDTDDKAYADAEEAYLRAVELMPVDPYNHLALASFYDRRNNFAKAEPAYIRALELDPDNVSALTDYASYLVDRGRAGDAAVLVERAGQIAPDNADLALLMGDIAFRKGRLEEARERALWVLSQDAENRQALTLLTKVKARKNPFMGIWLYWAMFMGRFSGKQQLGIILGLWLLWQVFARTLLPGMSPTMQSVLSWGWLGFVLMTWVGPYIFARMVQSELKDVTIRDDY